MCNTVSFVALILFTGCKTLIPDYEVLRLPRPIDEYKTGRIWISGVGPTGEPVGSTTRGPGAAILSSGKGSATKGRIEASFTEWASGILGFDRKTTVQLSLTNLEHEIVRDVYALAETTPVLYETITAKGFDLQISKNLGGDLSADALGQKLTDAIGGTIKFTAAQTNTGAYRVSSDRPVVVAIRVISPRYRVNSASGFEHLDLSSMAVGKPQLFRFGYEFILQEVEQLEKTANVRVNNRFSRQFLGTNVVFRNNEPWISPKRTAIQGEDRELRDAQFVWDRISLVWMPDRTNCQAQVIRQYLDPVPVKSGLSTAR